MRKPKIIVLHTKYETRYELSQLLSAEDLNEEWFNATIKIPLNPPAAHDYAVSVKHQRGWFAYSNVESQLKYQRDNLVARADRWKIAKMTEAEFWTLFDEVHAKIRQKGGEA